MSFEAAERIADAVLSEGYVLYPYRASAVKNRMRWQFGVVAPRDPNDALGEPWFTETVCLVEPDAGERPLLSVRVRFLRVQERAVDTWHEVPGRWTPADRVTVGDRDLLAWTEGVPETATVERLALDPSSAGSVTAIELFGGSDQELVRDARGVQAARVTRRRLDVLATLETSVTIAGPYLQVRVRLENLAAWRPEFRTDREAMLKRALVNTHLMLEVSRGQFVSLLDPPEAAVPFAGACRSVNAYPVLVGESNARNLVLSSPIVLYDYPRIAPASPGDLCDGTEIDEILSLRIMTMTDEEKREARATDPRADRIIARTDALDASALAAMHGEMIPADFFNPPGEPSPAEAALDIDGWRVSKGVQVRLSPKRRADAMDMFLQNQVATVAGVYRDLENRPFVAVTVNADPAADLHESFGRFFYFAQDEIDPLETT